MIEPAPSRRPSHDLGGDLASCWRRSRPDAEGDDPARFRPRSVAAGVISGPRLTPVQANRASTAPPMTSRAAAKAMESAETSSPAVPAVPQSTEAPTTARGPFFMPTIVRQLDNFVQLLVDEPPGRGCELGRVVVEHGEPVVDVGRGLAGQRQ